MESDRKKEGLSALGHETPYHFDYAPQVLETFVNKHPEMDYWVRFNCPEFTTICPITGQPDFAEIRISYIPDQKMVESKSLKLYLGRGSLLRAAASRSIPTPITAAPGPASRLWRSSVSRPTSRGAAEKEVPADAIFAYNCIWFVKHC